MGGEARKWANGRMGAGHSGRHNVRVRQDRGEGNWDNDGKLLARRDEPNHSYTISLSLPLWPIPLLPLARFFASLSPIRHWYAQLSLGSTDSHTTSNPFVHGLFIALMMEAVGTTETSVYSNETTWRYIPEGSNLQAKNV
jgi:hypothetical protein